MLVGLDEPDDAAVYQLDETQAIISTTDFFPPVVDTPYEFGAIAAANALSDVYAMGGVPCWAINLVAWREDLPLGILQEILRGGAEKVREAGAVIAGGHSISDQEPKYGISVTGRVHPDRIIRKSGARVGDRLILTKPLGTGVITTALKRGLAEDSQVESAVAAMARLNDRAARLAQAHHAHAMTDITGFGLAGHGQEMARLSRVGLQLDFAALRWLPGALQHAERGVFPGGMERNRDCFSPWLRFSGDSDDLRASLLHDPQTSGGLLMAVDPTRAEELLADLLAAGEAAALIGEVVPGAGELHVAAG